MSNGEKTSGKNALSVARISRTNMRAASDGAANGAGLRCPRPALVRLYYGVDVRAVPGSDKLRGLTSVAQQAKATVQKPLQDNETIAATHVIALVKPRRVRENTVAGTLA